ncbi:hypothetical protein RZS28_06050 [Methylocapsa polymorpha]|uniref:Uncharacterized protein n=1 Tax=Methylocapsa polymorpha TaxID=3080828 RepID=A0ABZ0HVP3_9HYPH|nr:hypothetical protein RZS28_06050 [Methylocapsa sp. RX1]
MIGMDRAFTLAVAAFVVAQTLCAEPVDAQAARADSPTRSQTGSLDQAKTGEAEPSAASPAAPPPPNLALYGTIVYDDGSHASAFLRIEGSSKLMSVGVGDDVLGWTVEQIAEKQIVLSRDDHSIAVTLNYALDTGEHPVVAVAARPKKGPPLAVRRRARRVFEVNASGVLRLHMAKKPPGEDD